MARQGAGGLTPPPPRLPVLYGITDPRGPRALTAVEAVSLLLDAGVTLVQVRIKAGSSRERLLAARAAVEEAHRRGGGAIVNDRCDLALLSGADGVHLGEEDLPADAGRRLLGEAALIGVSTHRVESARRAMEDVSPSYVALGPIFETGTRVPPRPALGLGPLEQASRYKTKPLVAIGGIRPEDVGECLSRGADAVAMIAGLLDGDVKENVRKALASAERAGFRG